MATPGGEGNGPETRLVGDIGATNARFGLVSRDGAILNWRTYPCANYPTIDDALAEYLGDRGGFPMPRQAAIAIASAITGDRVAMTNHPWSFSISALRQHFAFERLEVVNDFTAQALALPRLGPADRISVGGGTAVPGTPLAVLRSGIRARRVRPGSQWRPLAGADRGGRACNDGGGGRPRERGSWLSAPPFGPRLGRARAVRAGARQPL